MHAVNNYGAIVGRMDPPRNCLRLRIRHDGTCIESRITDGVVISERELDSVPEKWPECTPS